MRISYTMLQQGDYWLVDDFSQVCQVKREI